MGVTTVWLFELILFYVAVAALIAITYRYAIHRVLNTRALTIWLPLLGLSLLWQLGVLPSFPGYDSRIYGPDGRATMWSLSFARRGDNPATMCEWLHFNDAGYKFYLQKPHAIRNPDTPDSCWYALPDGLTFGDNYRGCYLFKRLSDKNYRRIDAGCSGEKSWAEFVNDETQSALFFRYYSP